MIKNWKKFRDEKINILLIKITSYLSLGSHKGRPSHTRSLQLSKHEISFFSNFVGNFFALLDPDPDPADQTQCGSGLQTYTRDTTIVSARRFYQKCLL
jgi:hypothetical protein